MRAIASRRPTTVDTVLAAALTLASQAEIWAPRLLPGVGDVTGSRPVLAATTLAMTLPLVLRRTAPLLALMVVFGAAVLVAVYSSSAFAAVGRAAVSAATIVVAVALLGLTEGDSAFMAIVFGSAWLMGFVVAQRSGQLQRASGDNRELAERLSEATALLAEAERRRSTGAPATAPSGLADLTSRELEVARAIATGMTNAEIAASLVISEWTVKSHVASILRKLGLRDRTQVVVAAYESGLLRAELPPDVP